VASAVTELQAELAPEERLLWASRPKKGVAPRGRDVLVAVFGILLLVFALFFEWRAWRVQSPVFFVAGLVFVLLGLYLVGGRFFLEARVRAGTRYGITNRRVLIRDGTRGRVRAIALDEIDRVEITERRDLSGTLRLVSRSRGFAKVGREQRVPIASGDVLELVPNVREAYAVLEQARGKL
jgi:hypothetical protein